MLEDSPAPASPLRARRTGKSQQRVQRLTSSIRLPWGAGLVTLLVLALAIALLVARTRDEPLDVPKPLRELQQLVTVDTAQDVRRSMNEGVNDLSAFGAVVSSSRAQKDLQRPLKAFVGSYGRYLGVSVLDRRGRALASAGEAPPRRVTPSLLREAAILPVERAPDGSPLIIEVSPVRGPGGARAVVARYDTTFLRFTLQGAEPGSAWVVDAQGRMLGALGENARMAPLPSSIARTAANRGAAGLTGTIQAGGSPATAQLVSYAPISGFGPAGETGWSVVTSRSIATFVLPETGARREAALAGIVLGLLVLTIFGWLYLILLRPLVVLQQDAERLAAGDLSKPVTVVRYDEIGLVARALERLRVQFIRKRVQESRKRGPGEG